MSEVLLLIYHKLRCALQEQQHMAILSLNIYSCVVAPEMPIIQHYKFTSSFSLAARTWFQQRPGDRLFFFWQSDYYKIKIPVWVVV